MDHYLQKIDFENQYSNSIYKYDLISKPYQRFKADKTESRNHKADSTEEFLHILEK